MLVGIAAALATPRFRSELNVAYGFVLVAFSVMACVGVWISLNWRNVTEEELDGFPAVDDRPSIPDDAMDGRFASDEPWMGMVYVAGRWVAYAAAFFSRPATPTTVRSACLSCAARSSACSPAVY